MSRPGLSVVKSGTWVDDPSSDGSGDNVFGTGDLVTYSFVVTNTGNVTLADIAIVDPLPGLILSGGPLATLAPGAVDSTTFTGTYTVTQTDTDRGAVTNVAKVTGRPPSGGRIESPPSSITLPPDQTAALEIEKNFVAFTDVDGSGTTNAGDTAHYRFDVHNTGRVNLSDVSVQDALRQAIVSGTIAVLAPGATDSSITATYTLTQEDIDAGEIENSATASGFPPNNRPPVSSVPSQVTEPIPAMGALSIAKTGRYDDSNGDGHASAGDVITYQFEVTNTGNTTLSQVSPVDAGPSFDGIPAEAKLSGFTPRAATLAPRGRQLFTATYTLTQNDAERAGGKADAVANVAAAKGVTLIGIPVLSANAASVVTLPGVKPGSVTLTKQALTRVVRRGEQAMFRIELTNNGPGVMTDATLVDTVPTGFRYVDGSAFIGGEAATPTSSGRRLEFSGLNLTVGQTVDLELKLLALASATPGTHVNLADALGADGTAIATQAQAGFELIAEGIFDCSDIIGKVFDDRNQNGYQDEGEPGLPGSRLVTARGLLITVDQFGRYSVPCAAIPDARIGSNFIIKLDEASLPTGYSLTTENPEVARLTAGKMVEVNFGASLGREVRLDLDATAFFADGVDPIPPLVDYLPQLIGLLAEERAVLRLGYLAQAGDALAEKRLEAIEATIERLWQDAGKPFALTIEMTVEQK